MTLRALVTQLDPDRRGWIIDAGAGVFDYYFEWAHNLHYRTAVIEPLPCEQVRELCAIYHTPLIEAALDTRDGKAYLTEHPGGLYSLQSTYWGQTVSRREVATVTYATALARLNANPVTALKLDIEGKEPDVLLQLREHNAPPVIVWEFGGVTQRCEGRGAWSHKARWSVQVAYDHLVNIGYRSGLMIVAGDRDELRFLNEYTRLEQVFQPHDAWGNIVMTTADIAPAQMASWAVQEVAFG